MQQLVEQKRPAPAPAPPPPESLEAQLEASIRTPPVARILRTALLTMGLTTVPLFAWATMTTIERAVIAGGKLIPEGRRKTVNLLEPGILQKLEVQEGSVVQAGQVLLRLDVTQAEATAKQAFAQYWGGRARVARLRAEQGELRRLVFPEDLRRAVAGDPSLLVFVEAETSLFAARWHAFDAQIAVQERQNAQYREQMGGARAQREAAELQVRSTREQISGLNRLLQQGFASRFTVLELQRQEASFVSTIGQAASQESQLREAVIQGEKQLAQMRLARLSDIANDLQTTEAAIETAQQQLRAAQDVLNRREVVAPEAGKVTNIQAFTPGASIGSGAPILDLVPAEDRLVIEASVQPLDIEQVVVGQAANIRLMSYRVRNVPLVPGRVISVAADSITLPNSDQPLYPVRIEIDAKTLEHLPQVALQAGMPVTAFILGEKRTPLAYFWAPIRESTRRAFRD